MQNLLNDINSKIKFLNSNIEEIIYEKTMMILQEMKNSFKKDFKNSDIEEYFEQLKNLQNIQVNLTSHLNSYDEKNLKNPITFNENKIENDLSDDAVSVSASISSKSDMENLEKQVEVVSDMLKDNYYFYKFDKDYGEINKELNLKYKLKTIEEFDLFLLKISGIKLFDNVFLGRTIRESMMKLFSFLFMLNEKPFISICEKNTKYFSTSPSNMKKPIMLKENQCYFESNTDESEASEVIKTFLKHINIELSSCKILTDCTTTKSGEGYITIAF